MTQPIQEPPDSHYVRWLTSLRLADVSLVGGKNAGLGELTAALRRKGISVPDGFATTVAAYWAFVEANHIHAPIRAHLAAWQRGAATLQQTGKAIRRLFLTATFPPQIATAICQAYQQLSARSQTADVDVVVRSSAMMEDLSTANVAGQQGTVLHASGAQALLEACRICYASLFTDRAISCHMDQGVDHLQAALSIGVQKMVQSDLAGAGVVYTLDPETGFPGVVAITAAWGLGERVVQGTMQPDEYQVFTPVLRQGLCPIIEKRLGEKAHRVVYPAEGSAPTRLVEMPLHDPRAFVLTDDEILQLARWAVAIEDHFDRPMAIEWAKDGQTGELCIVQARPETVQARKAIHLDETRTRIMLQIDDPDTATRWWPLPCHGIGLVRVESIINSVIACPSPVLARGDQLSDAARGQHQSQTRGYTGTNACVVEDVARGIGRVAASQHPKPVIVQLSDIATAAYASRSDSAGFALECAAIKRAREQMGFENLIALVPSCRTLEEADQALAALAANGLRRGDHGLRIYVTLAIPSNGILVEAIAERFDGICIDSPAQLIAAQDEAGKRMIRQLISAAHAAGRPVGICGQAPSDDPEFASFLVEAGIDWLSLSPESVIAVTRRIATVEHAPSRSLALAGRR